MTTHVVYLTPHSAFLPQLRSDTLWGMLCWAMRMVHGEKRLEQMLESYHEGEPELLISSAFLWHRDEQGHKQHTFPRPTWRPDSPNLPRAEAMQRMSLYKRLKSIGTLPEKPFLDLLQGTLGHSLPELETALERQQQTSGLQPLPSYDVDSVTHNTIDRIKGGTLSIDGAGQLFHVEEQFVKSPVESGPG